MPDVFSYVVGFAVLAVIAWYVFAGLAWLVTDLLPETYRALRYDRRGVCYKCKQPFQEQVAGPQGTSSVTQGVCVCGNRSLPRGNRSWTDWADF